MNIFTDIKNQLAELTKTLSAAVSSANKGGPGGSAAAPPTGTEGLTAIAGKVTDLQARVEQTESDLGTARQTIATLQKSVEAKDSEIAGLKAAATKAETDHKAELEAKETSVEGRAKTKFEELAASQGLKPGAAPAANAGGAGNGASVEALWAKYATLSPEAKVVFYREHKELHPK